MPTIDKLAAAIVSGCANPEPCFGPQRVHCLLVCRHFVAIAMKEVPTHNIVTERGSVHFLDCSAVGGIDDWCLNTVLFSIFGTVDSYQL